MLDSAGRPGLDRIYVRVGNTLAGWGLTPDGVTLIGILLHIPVVLLLAVGEPFIAAIVLAVAGLMDFFDGAVAKARGGGSRRGAFFDSVADRLSDGLLLLGVGLYAGRTSAALVSLTLACLISTYMISYVRAKAELSGYDAHVGLMERGERLAYLGVMLAIVQWVDILGWLLLGYLILTTITVVQRFVFVWRQGQTEPPLPVEEARMLPEWSEIRGSIGERDGNGSVREVFAEQRDEWRLRRLAAHRRRQEARQRTREVRSRINTERVARRGRSRPSSMRRRRVVHDRRP